MKKEPIIPLCDSCANDPAFCEANVGDFILEGNEIVECVKYEEE